MAREREDRDAERIIGMWTGAEATVKIQLRTKFPGLGGTVLTREGVAAALRTEHSQTPFSGHRLFIKHLVFKKLDDFFYRTGAYVFSHIPRPFGSLSKRDSECPEAYLYEWTFGQDGFAWERRDFELGTVKIILRDWDSFTSHFNKAGINMMNDISDVEDGYISKNIVHQLPNPMNMEKDEMCSLWKRIDFGSQSTPINFDKLLQFLSEKKDELIEVLGNERYEMIQFAVSYLMDPDQLDEYDVGKFEQLLGYYRRSSLSHYAFGFGPAGARVQFGEGKESLRCARFEGLLKKSKK